MVKTTSRPFYTREINSLPIVQEVRWSPRAGLNGCGKSHLPGFDPGGGDMITFNLKLLFQVLFDSPAASST